MWAAVAALSVSVASAVVAAVRREVAVLADRLLVPAVVGPVQDQADQHPLRVPVVRVQAREQVVLVQARLEALVLPRLRLLRFKLPQVAGESEVRLHLQGRQWFSVAMARSSPPTGKPTCARAPSTR